MTVCHDECFLYGIVLLISLTILGMNNSCMTFTTRWKAWLGFNLEADVDMILNKEFLIHNGLEQSF